MDGDTAFIMDGYVIFGFTIIAINICIFTPTMIYCAVTFYGRSKRSVEEENTCFFNRRHPNAVYAIVVFSVIFVAIERPLSILTYQMQIIQLPYQYGASTDPLQFFFYAICVYSIYFTFLQRFWSVFYTFKWYVAQSKLVWKKQLNPDYDENANFFFAYTRTLGKFTTTAPYVFCLWMVTVILLPTICMITDGVPFGIATFFLLCLPISVIAYIAYRISPITDRYFIRDELVRCLITMFITLCLHLLVFLCIEMPTRGSSYEGVHLQILLTSFFSCIQCVVLCYIITLWVLRKNDERGTLTRPQSARSSTAVNPDFEPSRTHTPTHRSLHSFFGTNATDADSVAIMETGLRARKLYNLLQDKHGFNLFMQHSVDELSVENLLFICEYLQFKKALCDEHLRGKIYGFLPQLPERFIPICESITRFPSDYLSQAQLIYQKYIRFDAPLELNVSARRRKFIVNKFDAQKQNHQVRENLMKNGWKPVSLLFDNIATEIWALMNDSFSRITLTEKYETWHDALPKNTKGQSFEESDRNRPGKLRLSVPA